MSRYIDAGEVLEQIRKKLGIKSLDYLLEAERQIVDVIQSAPSIDIVRCKKCIDFVYDEQYKCYGCANDNGLMGEINPDDFCSYGEREGE